VTAGRSSNGLTLVIIAGVVVVGAGAAGWFLFNKSEPAVAEPTAEKAPPTPATPGTPTKVPTLDPTTKVSATDEPAEKPDTPVREYYVDGKRIRDHRKGDKPPIDLPPVIQPPDARKMQPQSTGKITTAVKNIMRECVRTIPKEERVGEKPKMEAVVVIGVKDKVASVQKATIQLRDVRGSASDAAKSCIENKVLGVIEGVEEADLESYDISTSFLF
jgi:hypothetical protein